MEKKYKVVLLCTSCIHVGARTISALLKKNGIETELYFLNSNKNSYSAKELRAIVAALVKAKPDLIGISSIAVVKKKTIQLIKAIRSNNYLSKKKIAWGGMQATAEPDFCLKYADAVGVGECDFSFLELVNKIRKGEFYLDTDNFIFNYKNKKIVNKLKPLIEDLDKLPFEDYRVESHNFLKNSSILKVGNNSKDLIPPKDYLFFINDGVFNSYPSGYFENLFPGSRSSSYSSGDREGKGRLYTCLARGCPLGCTYCMNNYMKRLYSRWGKIRYRSNEKAIRSLKGIIDKFNPRYINLLEDDFFLRSTENIKEFSKLYRKFIKKSFTIQGTPWSFSEEKLKPLIDAGLRLVIIGIQSGSNRVNRDVYHRYLSDKDRILKVAKIINKYKNKMTAPWYDFIIDNPYETSAEKLETIRLIDKLPPPFSAKPHNLVLFPNTELYERAKNDGILKGNRADVAFQDFNKRKKYWENNFYLNFLMSKISGRCTAERLGSIERKNLKKLTSRPFIEFMEKRKGVLMSKDIDLNSLV